MAEENSESMEPNARDARLEGMQNAERRAGRPARTTAGPRLSIVDTSASFETFYDSAYPDLVRALSLTLGDAGWGREAADEAMTRAYDRWNDVSTYTNPAGWTYRVGLNWARSWHRKLARRLPWSDTDVSLPHAADPELEAALAELELKYRTVVVCRYLLDWSTEETAAALDIAPGTVKSRLSRGLDRLRSALEPSTPQDAAS